MFKDVRFLFRNFILLITALGIFFAPILAIPPRIQAAPNDSALTLRADGDFTCAISAENGDVECWGENQYGQLGNGLTGDSDKPVTVNLGGAAKAVAVGHHHACAVLISGGVKCWGYNGSGQLGDNSTQTRLSPVDVVGLGSGVRAIDAGLYHTCALLESGAMKCWGNNGSGRLGDGTTTNQLVPVNVSGMSSGVSWISAGDYHSCAVQNGAAKCWGANNYYQIGDGTNTTRKLPMTVSGLGSGVKTIDAIYRHTCALTTNGSAKCWGDNKYGQLGDGSTTTRKTPVNVSGLTSKVKVLIVNDYHSCAVMKSGAAKCWGYNGRGALGDGTKTNRSTPTDVNGLQGAALDIDAGWYHTCAVLQGGRVQCWGDNDNGQVGDGTRDDRLMPVTVMGFEGAQPVDCTPAHELLDPNTNLIANPSAESDTASATGNDVIRPISHWDATGNFTIVQYGASRFPKKNSVGPAKRGVNLFAGGPDNESSTATQLINLTPIYEQLNGGFVRYNLQAYLGANRGELDNAQVTLRFRDSDDGSGDAYHTVVLSPNGNPQTSGLLLNLTQGSVPGQANVPTTARSVEVELKMTRSNPSYNDALADKLWLSLYEAEPLNAKPPEPGGLAVQIKKRNVTFDWEPTPCITHYRLEVKYAANATRVLNRNVFETEYYHTNFSPATYEWRVRACNGTNCHASNWNHFVITP